MPKQENSRNMRLRKKKGKRKHSSKKDFLKQTILSGKTDPQNHPISPKDTRRPKMPGGTKTVKADTYELNLVLSLTMGKVEVAQRVPRTETLEKIIDEHHQIFKAGTLTILLKKDQYSLPAEMTKGMDARDVELILKLFGLAK